MSSAGLSLQIDPAKRLEKRNKAQVGIQEDEMKRRMDNLAEIVLEEGEEIC